MTFSATASFGALTIYITSMSLVKTNGTVKRKVGGRILIRPMPDKEASQREWSGNISGIFWGTGRDTDRDTLQGYADDLVTHELTDGNHNGMYYITNIRWLDNNRNPTSHKFTMTIIEEP